MQKQTNRVIVAAVLIAAAVTGGFFVFTAHRRAAAIDAAAGDAAARVAQMIATAGDIASTQHGYVAPGQPQQPWLERGAVLLQRFGQDAVALRALVRSPGATADLDDIDTHFKSIVVIDGKARESLQDGQHLLAADLIFSEGHDTAGALVAALRRLDASERQGLAAQRERLERQQWGIVGGVATLWLLGLIAMVRRPGSPTAGADSDRRESLDESNNGEDATPGARVPDPAPMLAAAAAVCAALARTADMAALREALARAASVLDARGLIVWMGAGEQLFPALAHGYDESVLERLGPIPRNASNATAEAWRTAQLRTVASNPMSDGAVAAPVSGVNGCVGVLAAEVRNGREGDAATRAVAAMFAAQLAGIMPAWPAASSAPDAAESERRAASRR